MTHRFIIATESCLPLKLLLTDIDNPLGRALEHELEREPFGLITPASGTVDWRDAQAVAQYIDSTRPGLVINTLGWADRPDAQACEQLPVVAANLGRACQSGETAVVQFSSYRVFGPDNKSSHSERDEPDPQSESGSAWWAAEQALQASLEQRIVLRLSWAIAAQGDNLLTRLLEQCFSGQPLAVNTRLRGAPTALSDVARVVVGIVKQVACGAQNWGVMHYCSSDACSQSAFAERVLEVLEQLDALPEPPPVLERLDNLPDAEPVSAVLSCRRVRDSFGVQARAWDPTLVAMVKQWLHNRG